MKKIITLVLSLFGMIGLTSQCVMYGTPHADFSLKGKVTDDNSKPLSKIGIEISEIWNNTDDVIYDVNKHVLDTVYTISDGSYSYFTDDAFGNPNIEVKAFDPDSVFATQSNKIELDFKGKKGWYNGKAEANQDFKLKKK